MTRESQIHHLMNLYNSIEYAGDVFANPESVRILIDAMKPYSKALKAELGDLERRLEEEKQAKDLVAHLIIVRNPLMAMMMPRSDIEHRKVCMDFYKSKTPAERKKILGLRIR